MDESLKKMIRELVLRGLTLVDYGWSDVHKGQVQGMSFKYKVDDNPDVHEIELGDVDVDLYEDCGDVCVDFGENLYMLDPMGTGVVDFFDDFEDDKPGIQLKDIEPIHIEFDVDEFYSKLMDYYEY
jgi:hypothetical protein